MIIRDRPSIFRILFAVRGSVVPKILPPLLVMTALSAGVVWFDGHVMPLYHPSSAPFAVFGLALSLFLSFRNNAAYDRWWEARKLWGGLLADLRSFARESDMFLADKATRQEAIHLTLAFLHLHRLNLRRLAPDAAAKAALAKVPDGTALLNKPPCAALDRLGATLAQTYRDGGMDGFGARSLSQRLANISLQQAGCERIANTPLPFVYSLLIYRTTYLYCLILPLSLVEAAGWLSPFFVAVVAYLFFGLAEVTEELAQPFANTLNGLPLDAICRAAEISLAPHLGETAPPPLQPDRYHLS